MTFEPDLDAVAAGNLTLKAWSRRWVILSGIAFVILDLAITLTVVVILAHATREADKNRATAACANTKSLAVIERANVRAQAKQTDDLVKKGNTFGIPKAEFDRLIKESEAQQARFLGALDKLVRADCKNI